MFGFPISVLHQNILIKGLDGCCLVSFYATSPLARVCLPWRLSDLSALRQRFAGHRLHDWLCTCLSLISRQSTEGRLTWGGAGKSDLNISQVHPPINRFSRVWLRIGIQWWNKSLIKEMSDLASYRDEKLSGAIYLRQYHPNRSSNSLISVIRSWPSFILLFSDIDECAIPELAGKCVENAECCNLPAEYVCKCRPGFEGDGQLECRGELELV